MKYLPVLFLNLLVAACLTSEVEARQPNVIFILADDLGWADTTLYGHTRYYQTPHLERLARRGMTFTRAYSASPLCSPTRASILTGLSPARLGLTTPNCHVAQVVLEAKEGTRAAPGLKAIQPEPVTRLLTTWPGMARALKAAGYATGHFGKWHLGAAPYSPLEQGFDVDLPHTSGPGPAGSYVAPWKYPDFDPDPAVPDQHIEDRMAKEAVGFMEKHRDRPFFLNYWMFSVHAPFDAKKALIEKYRRTADPANPQHCPTYAAMVESMDDAVGTLLDAVDRLGLAEHTIIVFFSDNGGNMYNEVEGVVPTSNAPLRGGKATIYEGGVRVPCVVSCPGVTAPGSRSDVVIQSTDFFPSLLEMTRTAPQPGQIFDGVSIVPALTGGRLSRDSIFTYFPHDPAVPDWVPPSITMTQDDWKLVRLFHQGENGAHRWQLYHLKDDPGERRDLAASEPERVQQMDQLVEKYLTETKAVRPVRNPAFDPTKYQPGEEGKNRTGRAASKAPGKGPAKPAAPGKDDPTPGLQGWRARQCSARVSEGIATVTPAGNAPFLGMGVNIPAGAAVSIRVRSQAGGEARVEWLPQGSKPQSVPLPLTQGDWQEVRAALPGDGGRGILRVYLPPGNVPVELDWIRLQKAPGDVQSWEF